MTDDNIHYLQCSQVGCKEPVTHSQGIGRPDYCKTHAEELMRCKSGMVHATGDCMWCDAIQGEACRLKTPAQIHGFDEDHSVGPSRGRSIKHSYTQEGKNFVD